MKPRKEETALTLLEQPMIAIPGVKILDGGMGVEMSANTPFQTAQNACRFFRRMKDCTRFMIGDLILFSEAIYGEKYAQLMDETGYAYESLAQMVRVCKAVPHVRRVQHTNVTFEHHYEVAKLKPEDQVKWLEITKTEGLTKSELRASIKAGCVVRAVQADKPEKEDGVLTIEGIVGWATKWIKDVTEKQPIEEWSNDRRAKVKAELHPVIEFYEKL